MYTAFLGIIKVCAKCYEITGFKFTVYTLDSYTGISNNNYNYNLQIAANV